MVTRGFPVGGGEVAWLAAQRRGEDRDRGPLRVNVLALDRENGSCAEPGERRKPFSAQSSRLTRRGKRCGVSAAS
jgi:hypothetical protein